MIYHSFVIAGFIALVFTLLAIDGNMKRIADALKAQNDFYGIFEQTSDEQELGIDPALPEPTIGVAGPVDPEVEERRG